MSFVLLKLHAAEQIVTLKAEAQHLQPRVPAKDLTSGALDRSSMRKARLMMLFHSAMHDQTGQQHQPASH